MSNTSPSQGAAKNRGIAWPTARRPAWISDEELDWLSADSRQEAVELIASTYQELVVEAETALERAAGEEFVFLFWLGVLRSLRLRGHSRWIPGQPLLLGSTPEIEIQNYLQLGLAKQRVANLLLRVKEWQARSQREGTRPAGAIESTRQTSAAAEPATRRKTAAQLPTEAASSSASAHASGRLSTAGETQVGIPEKTGGDAAQNGGSENGIGHHPGPLPEAVGTKRPHPAPLPEERERVALASAGAAKLEKPKSEGQKPGGRLTPLPTTR